METGIELVRDRIIQLGVTISLLIKIFINLISKMIFTNYRQRRKSLVG